MKEAIDHYQRLNGWMRTYCCPYLPWIKVGFGRGGPTANRTEWPVFDELPAVQAHRFLEAATAACGRMGEVANGRFGAFNFKNSGLLSGRYRETSMTGMGTEMPVAYSDSSPESGH
jgi:hypothetical protein